MALSEIPTSERESLGEITVRNVSKAYESTQALADVSFSVAEGEFCCIVGPSGRGKTTLLRTIARANGQRTNSSSMSHRSETNSESLAILAPDSSFLPS